MSACQEPECAAEIDWALTPDNARMPIDRDSVDVPGGTWAVWRENNTGKLRCRPLSEDENPRPPWEHRGTVHWATCKAPGKFRRTT